MMNFEVNCEWSGALQHSPIDVQGFYILGAQIFRAKKEFGQTEDTQRYHRQLSCHNVHRLIHEIIPLDR